MGSDFGTIETSDAGAEETLSRAYSAPESEQFTSGPYLPVDFSLYDYDSYVAVKDPKTDRGTPRWPWVVGIAAIVAAVALVTSVSILVSRDSPGKVVASPTTTTTPRPTLQNEPTTTTVAPPPPPPPTTESPRPTETKTVTVTPSPATTTEVPPTSTATAAPATTSITTPAGPVQVTYTVTGTKAPGDIISVTYVDATGRRRTQHNVYIPWSITVTPISTSDVGSVEAASLFRVSRLNCSITTSDGKVLSSNSNDSPQTNC